ERTLWDERGGSGAPRRAGGGGAARRTTPPRRSIAAAANPAAPPPTTTTRSGFALELRALPAVRLSAGSIFSRTNTVPLRFSTRQHGIGLKAGAATASPVRSLKQPWCKGHRTVSPTINPSASGPPQEQF